jgi:hypothetical protein
MATQLYVDRIYDLTKGKDFADISKRVPGRMTQNYQK